ncbi:MAG: leucine-rich repeat protein [Ruminococcus sp.]|nr:leucine-rich repeat protein [Ruminococcus sp.]
MKKIARFTFKFLCLVLSLNILQLSVSAERYYFDDDNFLVYQIIDGEVHITSNATGPYVEIPEEFDGYPVTTIDTHAFHINPDLEVIILPESLVTLESEAIAGCDNINSITIPAGVQTIGSYALGYDYVELYDEIGEKYSDFTIYGYIGTAAETYANENGFTFIALDDTTTETTITEETTTITTAQDWYESQYEITIDTLPDQITYSVGEELNLTGLQVSLVLYDQHGGTNNICSSVFPADLPDIFVVNTSEFDITEVGTCAIHISCTDAYQSFLPTNTVSFDVLVTESTTDTTTTAIIDSTYFGDINLDGKITMADIVYLDKAMLGAVDLNEAQTANADIYADGQLDAIDSLYLLKFMVNLVDSIPIEVS